MALSEPKAPEQIPEHPQHPDALPRDDKGRFRLNVVLNYFPEELYRKLWPLFAQWLRANPDKKFPAFCLELLDEYPTLAEEGARLGRDLERAKVHALSTDDDLARKLEEAEEKIRELEIRLQGALNGNPPPPDPIPETELGERYRTAVADFEEMREVSQDYLRKLRKQGEELEAETKRANGLTGVVENLSK